MKPPVPFMKASFGILGFSQMLADRGDYGAATWWDRVYLNLSGAWAL